jgi:hypothetical protein
MRLQSLDESILEHILQKLPPGTLCHAQLVCKHWYALDRKSPYPRHANSLPMRWRHMLACVVRLRLAGIHAVRGSRQGVTADDPDLATDALTTLCQPKQDCSF